MARLTSAQMLVQYLIHEEIPYALGIFGHGNIVLGEALKEHEKKIKFITVKNEQNAVHIAAAYAKMTGKPLAVTTSVGPGATNLVTGAFAAFVNRLPVLLLPGDAFADGVGPVLQEPDRKNSADYISVMLPVCNRVYRLTRPEQLRRILPKSFEAMHRHGNEGPVCISLPMDAQAESYDFDLDVVLAPRDKTQNRAAPDMEQVKKAVEMLKRAKKPLMLLGGGVLRSEACEEAQSLAEYACIPCVQTQQGKGALLWEHPLNAFHAGAKATLCGNKLTWETDLIIGIGTRFTDMTTASETNYKNNPKFINIGLDADDVGKQRAVKLFGDAKASLKALLDALKRDKNFTSRAKGRGKNYTNDLPYFRVIQKCREEWFAETDRLRNMDILPMAQSKVIGMVNDFCDEKAVVVSAAGSLPAEVFQLWRDKDPSRKAYHCESGASTMGYEICGGIGVKLADPSREAFVFIGDMSFLMANQEIVTAVQEKLAFTILLFDNHGGQSIRHLQMGSGFTEHGMEFNVRGTKDNYVDIDFVKIAEGMGAYAEKAETPEQVWGALERCRKIKDRPSLIHIPVDKETLMGTYEGWWDVPRPEVSKSAALKKQLKEYRAKKKKQVIR